MQTNFQDFKSFQVNEGFSKIKWTLPKESPALKIEGEIDGKKIILFIDVVTNVSAKSEWKLEKKDVAVLFSMYYKDNPEKPMEILMDVKDAERFYDRFNSIIKEGNDQKEQKKVKPPPGGGGGGGFGGF